MLTINEVNSAIMHGNFTNEQLNSIVAAVKYRRTELVRQQARTLRIGDSVRFASRGNVFFGNIVRMKIKNAVVRVGNGLSYNVPMSMLEAA